MFGKYQSVNSLQADFFSPRYFRHFVNLHTHSQPCFKLYSRAFCTSHCTLHKPYCMRIFSLYRQHCLLLLQHHGKVNILHHIELINFCAIMVPCTIHILHTLFLHTFLYTIHASPTPSHTHLPYTIYLTPPLHHVSHTSPTPYLTHLPYTDLTHLPYTMFLHTIQRAKLYTHCNGFQCVSYHL